VYTPELRSDRFCDPHRQVARELIAGELSGAVDADERSAMEVPAGWRLARLLTPDEERSLFIALNAVHFRANRVRSRIDPRRPRKSDVRELQSLLDEAAAVRQRIVEGNVRLVLAIAGKLADHNVSTEDLVGEGLVILLKAIDGFDYSRGFRFSTYATNSLQRHFFRVRNRAIRKQQLCRSIPSENLLHHSGHAGVELPPDDPMQLLATLMQRARPLLDERERHILNLRFGLGAAEHTLREIAAVTRVSKERVRQLLTRAVGKLRDLALEMRLEWSTAEGLLLPEVSA
jgi:RNA polymerase primary sigma factor